MVAWDVKQVKSQQVFICCYTSACIHAYMLPVFFNTDQSHRAPRFAETQSMSQQAAAAIRPYGGLVVEVCMGMGKTGIPWVPWDSHGNGSKISHGMGMGWEWKLSAWEWELRRGSCHQQL